MPLENVLAIIGVHSLDDQIERTRHLCDLAALDATLTAAAQAAGGDHESWEAIYYGVFGGNLDQECTRLFGRLGMRMPDYHDPDTTYQADATAWIEAFREVVRPVLEPIRERGTDRAMRRMAQTLKRMSDEVADDHPSVSAHLDRARAAAEVAAGS